MDGADRDVHHVLRCTVAVRPRFERRQATPVCRLRPRWDERVPQLHHGHVDSRSAIGDRRVARQVLSRHARVPRLPMVGRFARGGLRVGDALSRLFEPVLRPIRRVMPDTGAVDFSPMVFMLLLVAVSKMLQAATY